MKPVLCFGEVLWDAFGDGKVAGGAPMNVAWHLNQQGTPVRFASRVGIDTSGVELADFLNRHGLYSDLMQHDEDLPTCEVTVHLDEHGHAEYVIPEPVSWDNIITSKPLHDAAAEASAIVFGSLACRREITRSTLLNLLSDTKGLTVFDVNLRAPHYQLETIQTLAAQAQVIKMNEDEAALLLPGETSITERLQAFQQTYHSHTICITRGDKGAILWHEGTLYEHPGFKADVVDTVGAGDAFLATLITGLLNETPPDQILEKACKIGAYVAGQRGATPVYELKNVLT